VGATDADILAAAIEILRKRIAVGLQGSKKKIGDSSVTIAQWWRARHLRNVVIRKVPGSIPAENTSTQIHMDLNT